MSISCKTLPRELGGRLGKGYEGSPLSFLASAYESTILNNNFSFKVLSKKGTIITRH